jgi:hypothetical protein
MTGHYRMARGWMDHPVFANEPFTEREAWQWMIENAAFRARTFRIGKHVIPLDRGQLATTVRYLADAWQWSKSRVARFLDKLKIGTGGEPMIETVCGTEHTIITICKYDAYQAVPQNAGHGAGQETGHDPGHERDTSGTNQKELKELSYKYQGQVVRLNAADYDRWKRLYSTIPDLDAELARIDDALSSKPSGADGWFPAASAMLAAKHQRLLAEQKTKAPAAAAPKKSDYEQWRDLLASYVPGKFWPSNRGARPESGYCDAPEDLLTEWKRRLERAA